MPNQLFEMAHAEMNQPADSTQPNDEMSLSDTNHAATLPVVETNETDRTRQPVNLNLRTDQRIVDDDFNDDDEEFRARLNRDVEARIRETQKHLRRFFRNKPDVHAVVNAILRTAPIDLNTIAQDIHDGFRLRQ